MGESHLLEATEKDRPWVPASLVARLASYHWPGNVRQISNVVRQMVIASRDTSTLRTGAQVRQMLRDVPFSKSSRRDRDATESDTVDPLNQDSTNDSTEDGLSLPDPPSVDAMPERQTYRSPAGISESELIAALKANRWHVQATAAQLGVSRPSLYDRINRSPKIRKASELTRQEIEEIRESSEGDLDVMVETLEVSERGLLRRMTELGLR